MAARTQRTPVVGVPEQSVIALVRLDVVHVRRERGPACSATVDAERMVAEVVPSDTPPAALVVQALARLVLPAQGAGRHVGALPVRGAWLEMAAAWA